MAGIVASHRLSVTPEGAWSYQPACPSGSRQGFSDRAAPGLSAAEYGKLMERVDDLEAPGAALTDSQTKHGSVSDRPMSCLVNGHGRDS